MASDDDPEARIRELERPLNEQARASQLCQPIAPELNHSYSYSGYGRTPTRSAAPAMLIVAIALGLVAGIGAFAWYLLGGWDTSIWSHTTTTASSVPPPYGAPPSQPVIAHDTTIITGPAEVHTLPSEPGMPIQIAGVSGNRTIACDGNSVNISGVSNTIALTGHCESVIVSGIDNSVTVDSARQIVTSGIRNHVTYHSGTPDIPDPGDSNTETQG